MLAFSGKIVSAQRLESNYLSVSVRREENGLLGPKIQVLVPTLVELRDGPLKVGAIWRFEAQPAQSMDIAQGLRGFDFVVSRLQPGGQPDTSVGAEVASESMISGPVKKEALFP